MTRMMGTGTADDGSGEEFQPRRRRLSETKAKRAMRSRVASMRRSVASGSVLAFGGAYLPAHFGLPPSPMHRELDALLIRGAERRGMRLAVAAPRGHAKSTLISLAYTLWCMCYEKDRFIALISDTMDQAVGLLGHVRHELTGNDRLREDFPDACAPLGPPGSWRRGEIVTKSGVRITALGAEQKIRGRRHGASRPSLIVLDDVENEEMARSPEQRARRMDWLTGSALNAGSAVTNIIAAGTLIHPESLLSHLVGAARGGERGGAVPGAGPIQGVWEGRVYKAVKEWSSRSDLWDRWESIFRGDDTFEGKAGKDAARAFFEANVEAMLDGTSVLWPELEGYERLMIARLESGRRSFDAEKQNEPSSPERSIFREEDLRFWDGPDSPIQTPEQLIKSLGYSASVVGAMDPSLGKRGAQGDDTAIVTIVKDIHKRAYYVIDADIRRRRPQEAIDAALEYHKRRQYRQFGVETVQFQEFMKTELERQARERGVHLRVTGLTQTTDKVGRIQRLQPMLATGALKLSRRHGQLIDQLLRFPSGAHDDGPDALEMAVRVAETPTCRPAMGERGWR